MAVDGFPDLSANERALIAEAMRRVHAMRQGSDPSAIGHAVSAAWRQGRRDMFGLVKAGRSASPLQ